MRSSIRLATFLTCSLLAGCSSGTSASGAPGAAAAESDLTQDVITRLSDPQLETMRQKYEAAAKQEAGDDFYG